MGVGSYRDLIVWQKSMDLLVETYRLVRRFPKEEWFCLSQQMRNAVVSIPSNIAEGQGRGATKEYVRFLRIARGSLQELETQIIAAHRLEYVDLASRESILSRTEEVSRLLAGLIRSLNGGKS